MFYSDFDFRTKSVVFSEPVSSLSYSFSADDAVTSELSRLLNDIKKCRDYSFEELCHTISSHSMDSFGSGRLSDEEHTDKPNGTLTRVSKVLFL